MSGPGRLYRPRYVDKKTGEVKQAALWWADFSVSGRRVRKSAAVQMREAGIPEAHAMQFLGHKTASIFRRYAISNRAVLRSQARKLGAHYGEQPRPDRKVVRMGGGS